MKPLTMLSLLAALVTTAVASAGSEPGVPAYRWGEELRGTYPPQVAAGAYTLSGNLQIAVPGDVSTAPYALYVNSVGVERSQPPAPAGPFQVFLPSVAR